MRKRAKNTREGEEENGVGRERETKDIFRSAISGRAEGGGAKKKKKPASELNGRGKRICARSAVYDKYKTKAALPIS